MTQSTKMTLVPAGYLDAVWSDILPFVHRAVAKSDGRFTATSVYDDAKRHHHTVWIVLIGDAIVLTLTTRIVQYPCKRALVIDWVGGGDLHEVIPTVITTLKEHAVNNFCDHVEATGRRGWSTVLASHGWAVGDVTYKMEVSNAGR